LNEIADHVNEGSPNVDVLRQSLTQFLVRSVGLVVTMISMAVIVTSVTMAVIVQCAAHSGEREKRKYHYGGQTVSLLILIRNGIMGDCSSSSNSWWANKLWLHATHMIFTRIPNPLLINMMPLFSSKS
jgi:hypothetical protein